MALVRRMAPVLAIVLILLLLIPGGLVLAQGGTYTVQPGDTLRSIAGANGTTVEALLAANKDLVNPDLLSVGQTLNLPGDQNVPGTAAPTTITAPSSPTVAAPSAEPAAGSKSAASSAAPATAEGYTVQPGDTLMAIAERLNTTVSALMDVNDIPNPDILSVGTTLTIPEPEPPESSTGPVVAPFPAKPIVGGSYNRYGGGKPRAVYPTRLVASIAQQHCWLVENNLVTGSWSCSTGRSGFETPTGFYTVQSKMPVAYGSAWGFSMPYWLGLYTVNGIENGIHGLPYNSSGKDWGNRIGTPVSFGCLVFQDAAAKQIYDTASIGMQVIILK